MSKKIFLVYGHYNDKSFNAAIRDTFIKTAEECFVILPPVLKLVAAKQDNTQSTRPGLLTSTSIIGNLEHLAENQQDTIETILKQNVLPLNYEFS